MDRKLSSAKLLSTTGLGLVTVMLAAWAGLQALMQVGGLVEGADRWAVARLLLAYSVIPFCAAGIAWWRWLKHRHAQAWMVLLVAGVLAPFLVGPVLLGW